MSTAVPDVEDLAIGLTRDEIRLVARRQFVASVAAAFVIAAGAALLALVPTSHNHDQTAVRTFALVHQPTFVKTPDQRLASAIELP